MRNIRPTLAKMGFGAIMVIGISGCSSGPRDHLPVGAAAYAVIPEHIPDMHPGALQVGDTLYIRVLGEPDLTSEQYRIDDNGMLQMLLIGEIRAAGLTPTELTTLISQKLAGHFIRNPQVAISLMEHAKSGITVDGDVREPGRYEVTPGMTLIGAIAMAKSTTPTTKLTEIFVFRTVDGQRLGAHFNISEIRAGLVPDPQIIAGDTIVVGRSASKQFFRDVLSAAPLLNVFYVLK